MTHARNRQQEEASERSNTDLGNERFSAASSAEVERRHARAAAASEKRARRLAGETEAKLARDGLTARLWHGASVEARWVAPAVRELFARCVAACLANEAVRAYLEAGRSGWSITKLGASPVVRVEFEHAFVLGRVGESLCAARHKGWGEFLGVRPLEAGDPVHPRRVAFAFKEDAPYQRRFEQRRRLRRMLGKEYARLVTRAMGVGKAEFLAGLSEDDTARLSARTGLKPGRFWRAAKGREFVDWPVSPRQLTLFDVG